MKLGGIFRMTLPGKRRKEMIVMGGKPSQGTKKDMRLTENKTKPKAAPRPAKKK